MKQKLRRVALCSLLICVGLTGCRPQSSANSPQKPVSELRSQAKKTKDSDELASWLLAELVSPGGNADQARAARKKLDENKGDTMLASLARGIDDTAHGRLATAADNFMNVVKAARSSSDEQAPLIAWYAAQRAVSLRENTVGLWRRWRPFVETAIEKPEHLGWRTRDTLLDWWISEAWNSETKNLEEVSRQRYGCLEHARIAGPFGNNTASDTYRNYPAEAPGVWPERWAREPGTGVLPRILKTKRHGCEIEVDEPTSAGVFYTESFIDLPKASDLILGVHGAHAVWVDDSLVLNRDIRTWGAWPRLGARLSLAPGRHRIVARVAGSDLAIRILRPDGTPLPLASSIDPSPGYANVPPRIGPDPNLLMQFIGNGDVIPPRSDAVTFVAAALAEMEGQSDVASVLHESLVHSLEQATGPSLAQAAEYTEADPLFNRSQVIDLMRELNQRAVKKDEGLWASQLQLLSHVANTKGLTDTVSELEDLSRKFPEVPGIGAALASSYVQLGWRPEYMRTAKALAARFPENSEALQTAISVYEEEGDYAAADRLLAKLKELEPDSELAFSRALWREDYETAERELRAIAARRPERKELEQRIYEVLLRAGKTQETAERISKSIEKDPTSSSLRLALADLLLAAGDRGALYKVLAAAVEAGADYGPLAEAIDLVEGVTEMEPYRLDGREVIAAYEKAGQELPGTAARVLDYSVVWVHADGSSRMLEHEIVRIQSSEAINRFAEQTPEGLVLHMRVIKQDGRTLEPEVVPNKPTVTFPHLEIGDYIETEYIHYLKGVGEFYSGPRWFFREESIAYARSEFVVISPSIKPLQIETTGTLPEPEVSQNGQFIVRRWRVDHSPAAPDEPLSAPVTEFLPSVNIARGITLENRFRTLAPRVADTTPVDPRIARIARQIVKGIAATNVRARAQAVYRWIQSNVTDGEENDGRRVVIGKSGNRWQAMTLLCRSLTLPVAFALAKNRLAPENLGPITKANEYSSIVLRVGSSKSPIWLTMDDKYAPFAYLPAEVRGMPAYELGLNGTTQVTLPSDGAQDSILYEGDVVVAKDGSAALELVQRFSGKYAVRLRKGLAELPENRVHDVLESQVLGRMLRGARLKSYRIEHQEDLDQPLLMRLSATLSTFAEVRAGKLMISPPFVPNLSGLSTLPSRQTPLLIAEASDQRVKLRITLPQGAKGQVAPPLALENDGRKIGIQDRFTNGVLELWRDVSIPAGRVQPQSYPSFVDFTRRADSALSREVAFDLP